MNKRIRAQSAMEYLMTYGWAILIIAVVLGALFSLGVFSGGALLGTSCVAGSGYLCSSPVLGSNGNLSFTFGQSTGVTIYNIGMGCASTAGTGGLPNPTAAIVVIQSGGTPTGQADYGGVITSTNGNSIPSGGTLAISALKCFGPTGVGLTSSNSPLGTSFSGSIWLNYSASSGATTISSGSNPILTVKIATITTKIA
jgi:hypothetical protein